MTSCWALKSYIISTESNNFTNPASHVLQQKRASPENVET